MASKAAGPNGDVSSPGSIDSDVSEDTTWISWFTQLKGNEFFCEVEEEFIQDDFNLTGLSSQVTYYNYALDTILDVDIPEGELDDRQQEMVEVSAETLYGLIHARYILTARGMDAMRAKYIEGAFGRCPRVYCKGQHVLPVGISDLPRCSTVKIFCPMCWDLFFPRARSHNNLDGAYWGTTFPHIFLHTFHSLVPPRNRERYVPRIYGFKIHQSAIQVRRNAYHAGNPPSSGNDGGNSNNSGAGGGAGAGAGAGAGTGAGGGGNHGGHGGMGGGNRHADGGGNGGGENRHGGGGADPHVQQDEDVMDDDNVENQHDDDANSNVPANANLKNYLENIHSNASTEPASPGYGGMDYSTATTTSNTTSATNKTGSASNVPLMLSAQQQQQHHQTHALHNASLMASGNNHAVGVVFGKQVKSVSGSYRSLVTANRALA